MQQLMASAFLAAATALSPGLHHGQATPSPSPAVSAVAGSGILTQQSSGTWTTTVVLQASAVCLSRLSYDLVTTPPGRPAAGTITRLRPVQAATAAPVRCPSPAAQDEEVTVAFQLSSVPAAATLVVADRPGGPAIAPVAIAVTTVHRFVPLSEYLWVPVICGAALAAALLAVICAVALARFRRQRPDKNRASFWRKPIYASAAWTFKDSWATNIGFGATAVAATLTGAGAVSTLLPGVQLDRYAILLSICGAIIVAAPLVFGILYALLSGSRGMVPDNATLTFPPDETGVRRCEIQVAGGASVTLPAPPASSGHPIPVAPGQNIVIEDVTAVLPGDSTIVLMGIGNNGLRVLAPDATGGVPAPHASVRHLADASHRDDPAPDGYGSPELQVTTPTGGQGKAVPFATIKVTGFATMMLPTGTTARAPEPDGKVMRFAPRTVLRIPLGDNVMVADFRSLIPAALVTMFGIGAQLGTLGVLAFWLSNRTAAVRCGALAVIIVMAVTVLAYAIATTLALSDSKPGSAMTADSATSATL
jgi:hypothetical protein